MAPKGPSIVPVIVPIEDITLATVMALAAACERSRNVTAVHVAVDSEEQSDIEARWDTQFPNVPLVVIDSPFRTVTDPLAAYIDDRLRTGTHEVVVIIPVLEVGRWYHRPLVNQSLKHFSQRLARRRHAQIIYLPFDARASRQHKGKLPDSRDGTSA